MRRAAATLPLIALALPIATVEDCSTHEQSTRYGWQFATDGAWVFAIPALVYALYRVISPALPPADALASRVSAVGVWALESWLAAAALSGPALSSMFDTIAYRWGFWVQAAGWLALWVTAAGNAARAIAGLPPSLPRTTAGAIVAGWLSVAGICATFGPAAYGWMTGDFEAITLVLGLVLGGPLAIWGWSLRGALQLRSARIYVACLVLLSFATLADGISEPTTAPLVIVGGVFGLLTLVSLTRQLTETSAH